MKKLLNDPTTVVDDLLEGVVLADDRLNLLEDENIVVRADFQLLKAQGKVALICGGGSGHEPAHGGYVGQGMLTAAVAGPVFTSPSVDAILSAILTVGGPAGVLLIVKNYTGDRLNFGLAAEIARTSGLQVNMLVVGDDVALSDADAYAGRRGIAGTVFIHKVAGAAAEAGLTLQAVTAQARRAADQVFSMGLGLSACTVPAAGKPGFVLEQDQVEYGLGIHGESGVRREAIRRADAMVQALVERIVQQGQLTQGTRVALMVNNLGGTSVQELHVVAREALRACAAHGLQVELAMVGTFLTALEMAGCSLSVLLIDDELRERLLAPSQATGWPGMTRPAREVVRVAGTRQQAEGVIQGAAWSTASAARFKALILAVCAALKDQEQVLTELDSVVGDGDLGISLARGAIAIEAGVDELALDRPAVALQQLSAILRRVLGGTSGPLYAVFVLRAGVALATCSDPATPQAWSTAFGAGCQAMQQLGGADAGDRTMLDALLPAAQALARLPGAQHAAREVARAADSGAQATGDMLPRKGRSSYLGQRALGHIDPGAYAVTVWTQAIAQAFEQDPGQA